MSFGGCCVGKCCLFAGCGVDLANSLKLCRSCRCCFSGGVLGVGANVSPFSSTVSSSGVSDKLLRLWIAWLEAAGGLGVCWSSFGFFVGSACSLCFLFL